MSSRTRFEAQENGRALVAAVREDVEALVPALEALLFPDGVPERSDLASVLRGLADLLDRDLVALEDWERALRARETGNVETRRREAVEALRGAVFRVRTLLMAAFGPRCVHTCRLSARVPEAPEQLLLYARQAAQALERAAPIHVEPAPFITMDLGGAATFLREHIDLLDAALRAEDRRHDEPCDPADRRGRLERIWAHHAQGVIAVVDALASLVRRDERRRRITAELLPEAGEDADLDAAHTAA